MTKKTFSRLVLFIIYFWFGILKVIGSSPAHPLVLSLLTKTVPFISGLQCLLLLGIFEMIIGIVFLLPKYTRLAKVLFVIHMCMTFLPLILLRSITWQGFLLPTLEGQYIIKNLALIAIVIQL